MANGRKRSVKRKTTSRRRKKPPAKRKKKTYKRKKVDPTKKRRRRKKTEEARERRRLREERAPGRGITKEDRIAVYNFYGSACLKCGSTRRMCLDHVQALYCGGRHDPDNLQPMCWKCNSKKGIKTEDYRPKKYPY